MDCFDPSSKDVVDLLYALGKHADNNHYLIPHLLGAGLCSEPIMNIMTFNSHKCAK